MLRRVTTNILNAPIPVRLGLGYSLALCVFSFATVLLGAHSSRVTVPLHYSYRLGVDATGPWYALYAIPAVGAVLLAITVWLLERGETAKRPIAYFLTISSMLAQTVLLIDCAHFVGLATG